MSLTPTCSTCLERPRAHRRTRFCYRCQPGGPQPEPACEECGSTDNYFTAGKCVLCARDAPQPPDSCIDCHAWGVTRRGRWICGPCVSYRNNHQVDVCVGCDRRHAIDAQRLCRCCYRHLAAHRSAHGLKIPATTLRTTGQQLVFVNMVKAGRAPRAEAVAERTPGWPDRPFRHRQLVLFDHTPDLSNGRPPPRPPRDPLLAAALDEHVSTVADRLRWNPQHETNVRSSVRILLDLQDTPGASFTATEVSVLHQLGLPARVVRDLLDEVHMLDDDRTPAIVGWLDSRIDHLPDQIRSEVGVWFDVMFAGSTSAPRRRPRDPVTIRLYGRWFIPTLTRWADTGTTSMRTITRDDIISALAVDGINRHGTGLALRSLFGVLKARRLVFINPTVRLSTWAETNKPKMPADLTLIDAALNDPNPARAAVVALAIYHGLNTGQLRNIRLIDLYDHRLHINTRTIPLAEPARHRVDAYLADRARRWPRAINPHLFIHFRNHQRLEPVGGRWMKTTVNYPGGVNAIRRDRILHEAEATSGDTRRLCDLFGLSIAAASRFTNSVAHHDLN